MSLLVRKINKNATIPVRSTDGSAGYDFYSPIDVIINPKSKILIQTNISVELPECPFKGHIYCMKMMSRSGLSLKKSIEVGAGLIDSDYRGNIGVILYNHGDEPVEIKSGDRIAQGVIITIAVPEIIDVDELSNTKRGDGGYGSTGQ
jgi:dUTP pyrophosphatase